MIETLEQLTQYFDEHEVEGTGYFTEPSYVTAIVGMTQDERLVYDYDKMVEFLMRQDGVSNEEAIEFIDYNTIRSIPYMGEKAPVVLYRDMLEMI